MSDDKPDLEHPPVPPAPGTLAEQLTYEYRWAEQVASSGVMPATLRTPGAVMALKQTAIELDIPFLMAAQNFAFINGRLFIEGEMALALIRRSGKCRKDGHPREHYLGDEDTPERTCVIRVHRVDSEEPREFSYSLAEAERAGLAKVKDGKVLGRSRQGWTDNVPWANNTDNQLFWRCVAKMRRREFADVVNFGIRQEADDFPRRGERDITPPQAPDPLLHGGQPSVSPADEPPEPEEATPTVSPAPVSEEEIDPAEVIEVHAVIGDEAEPPACEHPDGFSADPEGNVVCIHCGEAKTEE